jgi:CCR4-NOT transcription complex subunit 1 HEAT repeat
MQELDILQDVLASGDHAFALDLALLANRREFLNLQAWLPGAIQKDPAAVVDALTILLDQRMGTEGGGVTGQLAPVTLKQIATVRSRT